MNGIASKLIVGLAILLASGSAAWTLQTSVKVATLEAQVEQIDEIKSSIAALDAKVDSKLDKINDSLMQLTRELSR